MPPVQDLLVVVADKPMGAILEGLLPRISRVDNTFPFSFEIKIHNQRDCGLRAGAVEFVRPRMAGFKQLLVLLDFEGSGFNGTSAELEKEIKADLVQNGWETEAVHVTVFEPECDIWMWVSRNKMEQIFKSPVGIPLPTGGIDAFLESKGFLQLKNKPIRPKEAVEALCRHLQIRQSAALYNALASTASYKNCQDRSFITLMAKLRTWFEKGGN